MYRSCTVIRGALLREYSGLRSTYWSVPPGFPVILRISKKEAKVVLLPTIIGFNRDQVYLAVWQTTFLKEMDSDKLCIDVTSPCISDSLLFILDYWRQGE